MKTDDGQLLLSIGALLAAEREKRGIPVERAAKETRMRPQRIRDMENDDLSHFTNPSYARMFLIAYAKYLGIPMRTINEHLPDPGESATEGYQYISTSTEDLPSLRHNIASKPASRNNALQLLVIVTLLVVLLGGGGLATYLAVNLPRLTADESNSKAAPAAAAPEPAVVVREVYVREAVGLANVSQDGSTPSAFGEKVEWTAPVPDAGLADARKPSSALNVTLAPDPGVQPTPQSVITEDQVFLLGAPPAKPTNAR